MEDTNYRTEPLEEAFSHEVTLAYPIFLKNARRFNSNFVATEDIVQEALGEAWKYASNNGMPKNRTEFVKWGVCIINWKILDAYKQAKKLGIELIDSDIPEHLTRKGNNSVVNEAIYNELYQSFLDRVEITYYSKNPAGTLIYDYINGENMTAIASKLGYSQSMIAKTKKTLDRIVSEVINP